MAIKTQGTHLYVVDPADESLITVGCVTSIDGIDTSLEQIETTCLEDAARSYLSGLATPGTATFGINVDTSDATHVRLHALKVAGTTLLWSVGWSDGTAPATVDTGGAFDLPTTRSWILFSGYMNSYPFSFAQNSVVQSTVGIQVSGEPTLIAKV
jgi:hypothetical protein